MPGARVNFGGDGASAEGAAWPAASRPAGAAPRVFGSSSTGVVEEAPDFACVSGITYTMGGVAIDPDARVLHGSGAAISGLFAAGGTVGGLEGGPYVGYTGGLAKALVFGWRAANTIGNTDSSGMS